MCHMSAVACHMSGFKVSSVKCQVSGVMCQVSCVKCHVSHIFNFNFVYKEVELVDGGYVIIRAYLV